jgi:hypothetical protein
MAPPSSGSDTDAVPGGASAYARAAGAGEGRRDPLRLTQARVDGVVRPEQAGAGSALNDATRQVGGTLGVAVLGSIYSTLYLRSLDSSAVMSVLPTGVRELAGEGVAQGLAVAQAAPAGAAPAVRTAVVDAFLDGLHAGCLTAAGVCLLAAVAVAILLPARPLPGTAEADVALEPAPALA